MKRYLTPLLCVGLAGALAACAAPPGQPATVTTATLATATVVTANVATATFITATAAAPAAAAPVVLQSAAPPPVLAAAEPSVTGTASWYRTGRRLHRTYSGTMLDNDALTAASSVLPMGTEVRVGLLGGSRSVVVLVNDRMPRNHRLIDLSEIAARELGLMGCGVAQVTVTPIVVASAP